MAQESSSNLSILLKYIEEDKFKKLCLSLGIAEDLYDTHIAFAVADMFDSLSDTVDDLHTQELLRMEEEVFLEDLEEDIDFTYE